MIKLIKVVDRAGAAFVIINEVKESIYIYIYIH